MSLSYQLDEIENWKDLKPGTVQTVCFATMFVGCPIIAESGKDDWRKVAARVHAWETVTGMIRADGERIGPDLIRRFIGLRTNASRMTDAQFRKNLASVAERRAKEAVDRVIHAEADLKAGQEAAAE